MLKLKNHFRLVLFVYIHLLTHMLLFSSHLAMLAIKPGIIFLSSFTTFCGFVTRLTRRVPLVEQELLILPEHLSSPPGFSRVRVTRSLVLYVCFVDHCLSFCTFSFRHCVVCSSSIYGF